MSIEKSRHNRIYLPSHLYVLAESGSKTQSVQRARETPLRIGDVLNLTEGFRGISAICTSAKRIKVIANNTVKAVFVDKIRMTARQLDELASSEGFQNPSDLFRFFHNVHGGHFEGTLVSWKYGV